MTKKEKVISVLITIVIAIISGLSAWGAFYYLIKDHDLQIEQLGFVKSDYSSLPFWENFLKNACTVVAIISILSLVFAIGLTIEFWKKGFNRNHGYYSKYGR